jgi:hypothetical protein
MIDPYWELLGYYLARLRSGICALIEGEKKNVLLDGDAAYFQS